MGMAIALSASPANIAMVAIDQTSFMIMAKMTMKEIIVNRGMTMDKNELLEDLSNVVRMIGNARPGTYDSVAHHCASFIRTHHAEIEAMARDTEMLDWIQRISEEGSCPALFNDDYGHWAFSDSGVQAAQEKPKATTFFAEPEDWKPNVRAALDTAMSEHSAEVSDV